MPLAICVGVLIACVQPVVAAPSGADLLAACERALSNGFAGVEGQMCSWYVRPCDCDLGSDPDAPRVCLAPDLETTALAREVTAGLRAEPGLQAQTAAVAAARVLSRKHPCAGP